MGQPADASGDSGVPGVGPAAPPLRAAQVRAWCRAGLAALGGARAEIDALNVYPVPDGDTGTNLFLTMESAVDALGPESDDATAELASTARAVAHGALLGARGNSGVILSQYLRAVAEVLADPTPRGGPEMLRLALEAASEAGYAAVAQPVEGTILSVVRGAAEAARTEPSADLVVVTRAAAEGAAAALSRTPDQLDALRRAGVVDAGGRGAVVLLEALAAVVSGNPPPAAPSGPLPVPHAAGPRDDGGPAYEVMFLLEAADDATPALRQRLGELGNSLLVVGGGGLWNVHVHVDDVGAAIEAGIEAGRPYRIVVTHFGDQVGSRAETPAVGRAVVAVAPGEGLTELYESSGAVVVRGGVGRKPATRDILSGIRRSRAAEIVVLPDDSDVQAVAEAAADQARESGLRVAVLPTRATVQVLAALAVHDAARRFEDDVVAMTAAARATRHGAVTLATREALTSAGVCRPGDVLGLLEGDVALIGADVAEVARGLLDRLLSAGGELATIVLGAEAGEALGGLLVDHLRRTHPEVEATVYAGGQTHYPVLVGVE